MKSTLDSHIESTSGVCGGRPRIAGTRIRVQDVYVWHELQGRSADDIVASFPSLTLSDVHAALAYFFDHRDEIASQMRADDEFVRQLRDEIGPGPLEAKLRGSPS
jgi:uncharacterized protein (DUF433 family)